MPASKYNPEIEPVRELRRENCTWWDDEAACLGPCRCEECPLCGDTHPPFGVDCDGDDGPSLSDIEPDIGDR